MPSRACQVRSTRRPQTAFFAPSPAPAAAHGYSFSRGGQSLGQQQSRSIFPQNSAHSGITAASQSGTLRSVVPAPTVSLQIRLREMDPSLLKEKEYKLSMKSVDLVADHFKLVYSGDPGQDWMNHVNELERQSANRWSIGG